MVADAIMDRLEVSRYLGQMTEARMKKRQEMVSPGVCVCGWV